MRIFFIFLALLNTILIASILYTFNIKQVVNSPIPQLNQTTIQKSLKETAPQGEKMTWILSNSAPSYIFSTILHDHDSWGPNRNIADYFALVNQTFYSSEPVHHVFISPSQVQISISVEDRVEFDAIIHYIDRHLPQLNSYGKLEVYYILHPYDFKSGRAERHAPQLQKERRRKVAVVRNMLIMEAIQFHSRYFIWIDADVDQIPKNIIQELVASEKDIVTLRCTTPHYGDYDLNAWAGTRKSPNATQLEDIRNGGFFEPGPDKVTFLSHWQSHSERFHQLDSVGGTFLFVKAEVHRKGVLFPNGYVIGTEWGMKEGWDGIETEGLCYLARQIGYQCWGIANEAIHHV